MRLVCLLCSLLAIASSQILPFHSTDETSLGTFDGYEILSYKIGSFSFILLDKSGFKSECIVFSSKDGWISNVLLRLPLEDRKRTLKHLVKLTKKRSLLTPSRMSYFKSLTANKKCQNKKTYHYDSSTDGITIAKLYGLTVKDYTRKLGILLVRDKRKCYVIRNAKDKVLKMYTKKLINVRHIKRNILMGLPKRLIGSKTALLKDIKKCSNKLQYEIKYSPQ